MALKFGPQWLRDLSDGGASTSQPSTPTTSVKFKLADYRYGREEMLALFSEHSTPPDQVRKHLSIFSKEIQKPITMLPLTEDEQRLVSQGFNSTVVLRAASRGSGPPPRSSRGGGAPDRGRGRGRGRGEGYISRTENGDIAYSRSTQDGWEQVGRKFERSYSRGYDDIGPKREYVRSSSDNWRDKKLEDDDDEEENGSSWRNNRERWGPSTRTNWREPQRDNFEIDRRPLHPRNYDPDSRVTQRTNESYDNEGDVPEWVADDVEDDPGTFDSSGAFVSTRQGKKYIEIRREPPQTEDSVKNNVTVQTQEDRLKHSESTNDGEKSPPVQSIKSVYVPPNARSGNGDSNDSKEIIHKQNIDKGETESHTETQISFNGGHSNKGDGDSGFSLPNPELVSDMRSPPGQNLPYTSVPSTQSQMTLLNDPSATQVPNNRVLEMDRLQLEKSLQNYVAEMTAGAERRAKSLLETSQPAVPLTNEDANKWFYKDPQGEVQGPFTSEEMSQWFSAGYFTMSLIVKRGCDDTYKPLGELIKRYGRVPFLPGPPLPPLITSSMSGEATLTTAPPLALVPPLSTPIIGAPLMNVSDPHLVQQMLIQQEFIKQTYLRHLQQLQQLQDPESFKALTTEQNIPMQMLMQANPALLMQQQLLFQQQQQQEQSLASVAYTGDSSQTVFQQSSSNNSSSTQNTATSGNLEDESTWPNMSQMLPGMWPLPTTHIPSQPPASLWDIDMSSGTISPAYRAQLEKLRRDREEERLKEEEKAREEELQKKKEELLRQQEEIERQREQMRREKEELERQKLLEIQKIEDARRLEEERIKLEIERQQREKEEEERRLQEIAKKQLEAERKREKELEKQEKKKRKEEEKRLEEERRRATLASAEKLVAQYEQCKETRKKAEEELRRQQEIEQQQREERMQKEAAEREKLDAQKKQLDAVRQQEAFRKLQQSQKDQLANIQLPASSNWAALQQPSLFPSQSKSLTEIQEEEARQEEERLREQQFLQFQRMQEQYSSNQSHQISQKSWATQNSQVMPSKGFSLLHIQQQEAEKAKKSEKEKINNSYTSKVALSSNSTWSGSGGTWGSSQPVWSNALSSTAGIWDSVAVPVKKSNVKESGEFPALKTAPSQHLKKTNTKEVKASTVKTLAPKLKKEEESVQKLFQNRQQDDFSRWVTDRVNEFSASIDVPTFVSFIVEVESPDEVQDYIKTYLGDNKESKDFAKKFVEKRNKFRNQARLVKQQEEDSIWGPAPAINPHNQVRGSGNANNVNSEGRDGTTSKAKNRKKKQKMQKMDGSILGFTVQADPNRKNAAGEFEVIE